MKCTLCIAHNSTQTRDDTKKKYTFLTGCSNLRTTSISDHEKSAMHINSVAQEKAKSKPATTIAAKTIIQLNEHRRQQLEYKFRNMHAVAKHNRPLRDYVWLNNLDKAKGLETGDTYNNPTAGADFLDQCHQIN
jgi:hypothetical protein